jgi:hypothetical protein
MKEAAAGALASYPSGPWSPAKITMDTPQRKDLTPLFVRLAVLWVAAGALFKLLAGTPADLPPIVRQSPLGLDLTFKLAIGIELAITLAALLNPRLAWAAVVALFVVFEGVLVAVAMDGSESCGCFGSSITIPPTVMMAVDGVLLVAILASQPWKSQAKALVPLPGLVVTTLVSMLAPFFIIGTQELQPTSREEGPAPQEEVQALRYVELHMDTWEGKMIYDTELAALLGPAIDTVPIDGTAVIYRATCDHCAMHLEELAMNDDGSRPILLIRVPDDSATEENTIVRTMPVGGHVTELTLPEGPQYLVETPADFQLEGAIIGTPREGIKVDEH